MVKIWLQVRNFRAMNLTRPAASLLMLLIVAVGLGARLYRLDELSLGNDDLSALTRLQHNHWQDLIRYGVQEDVHPAGVQVFLWGWTRLFGQSEWVLHLPFLLLGMLAIWLSWRLGRTLLSETGALLVAALVATTEFGIFHSLSIRPYMPGLCCLLALGLVLVKWTRREVPPRPLEILGLVLLGALAGYLHYMAALSALVMLASAWMLLPKAFRWHYLLALGGMAVLYLPHLGIFLGHLAAGGSAWMGQPNQHFFLRFTGYLFHFSWEFAAGILLLLLYLIWRKGLFQPPSNARWLLLDWALLPVGIEVMYSWIMAPVVHFGTLFFVYPFLLMLIFSWVREVSWPETLLVLVLAMGFSLGSLVWKRGFYDWNYGGGAKGVAALFQENERAEKAGWMLMNHPYYIGYYLPDPAERAQVLGDQLPSGPDLLAWADTTAANRVALAWLSRDFPLEALAALERKFPYWVKEEKWPICEYYELSRQPDSGMVAPWRFLALADSLPWQREENYVGTLELRSFDYITAYPEILMVSADAQLDSLGAALPQLVMSVEIMGEPQYWRSATLEPMPGVPGRYFADLAVRTRHLPELLHPDAVLKAYIWNAGGASGSMERISIRRRPGNPLLYAFVEPVAWER